VKRGPRREIFACPHCGADVPLGAKACKECGSDATTGWQDEQEVDYQSVDLPQGYAGDEDHPGGAAAGGPPLWLVLTALVAVAAVLLLVFGRCLL